ncbi:MAG: hypothetical protein ING19_00685 [Azospirillum sp.]|nr:hypothetical protein [Azospirillum sp.]
MRKTVEELSPSCKASHGLCLEICAQAAGFANWFAIVNLSDKEKREGLLSRLGGTRGMNRLFLDAYAKIDPETKSLRGDMVSYLSEALLNERNGRAVKIPYKTGTALEIQAAIEANFNRDAGVAVDANGGHDIWRARANAFLSGMLRTLVELRDRDAVKLDSTTIEKFLPLDTDFDSKKAFEAVVNLRNAVGEDSPGGASLRRYLESLPGYRHGALSQASHVLQHHGYLTMQIARMIRVSQATEKIESAGKRDPRVSALWSMWRHAGWLSRLSGKTNMGEAFRLLRRKDGSIGDEFAIGTRKNGDVIRLPIEKAKGHWLYLIRAHACEMQLGLAFNAIAHDRGLVYIAQSGDTSETLRLRTMAKFCGRENDLILVGDERFVDKTLADAIVPARNLADVFPMLEDVVRNGKILVLALPPLELRSAAGGIGGNFELVDLQVRLRFLFESLAKMRSPVLSIMSEIQSHALNPSLMIDLGRSAAARNSTIAYFADSVISGETTLRDKSNSADIDRLIRTASVFARSDLDVDADAPGGHGNPIVSIGDGSFASFSPYIARPTTIRRVEAETDEEESPSFGGPTFGHIR